MLVILSGEDKLMKTESRYKYVKEWRKRTKLKLISAFGSKCGICNYQKCTDALEFHHLSNDDKNFTISKWHKIANWKKLVEECKKCVLLCANCHREVHANVLNIPDNIQKLDENLINAEYR
jgi:hypothetical protein